MLSHIIITNVLIGRVDIGEIEIQKFWLRTKCQIFISLIADASYLKCVFEMHIDAFLR